MRMFTAAFMAFLLFYVTSTRVCVCIRVLMYYASFVLYNGFYVYFFHLDFFPPVPTKVFAYESEGEDSDTEDNIIKPDDHVLLTCSTEEV